MMRRTAVRWATEQQKQPPQPQPRMVRLNKLMADQGLCSRREADFYLKKGWVILNGQPLPAGDGVGLKCSIEETTVVELSKEAVQQESSQDVILLHKPLGIVSCQPEHDGQIPAIKLLTWNRQFLQPTKNHKDHDSKDDKNGPRRQLPQQQRRRTGTGGAEPKSRPGWAVAGRLDINSTGLLVLTQSGRVAREIIGPLSSMEKEYLVRIPSSLPSTPAAATAERSSCNSIDVVVQEKLQRLRRGVQDGDDFLQVQCVEQVNANQLRFVLTAGKHHHIRRMCRAVGLMPVQALKRVRIGNVVLGNLPLGQWRFLQPHERFV
jgi:23S rRNA pseudouridine2604 synthase